MNSLTYLTRRCPRKCTYCSLRDSNLERELNADEWIKAFQILKELGVDFNLILGNETWLLGNDLVKIMRTNQVPYAIYSTCPEPLFSKYRTQFFNPKDRILDNLSCGVDYPILYLISHELITDQEKKSWDAWNGLLWLKENYPSVDSQGTITITKENLLTVPDTIRELTRHRIFTGCNFIHWNKDGEFDFFPSKEELAGLLFTNDDKGLIQEILDIILADKVLLQNREMLLLDPEMFINTDWHCQGSPYDGPTVDADGSLRCCGYRAGKRTSTLSIFDLPERKVDWMSAVYHDAMECPGCLWSYPWMYHYWQDNDPEFGKKVFNVHAGKHISEDQWSKREIK